MKTEMIKNYVVIITLFFLTIVLQTSNYSQPLSENEDKFLGGASNSFLFRDFDKYWNQITVRWPVLPHSNNSSH